MSVVLYACMPRPRVVLHSVPIGAYTEICIPTTKLSACILYCYIIVCIMDTSWSVHFSIEKIVDNFSLTLAPQCHAFSLVVIDACILHYRLWLTHAHAQLTYMCQCGCSMTKINILRRNFYVKLESRYELVQYIDVQQKHQENVALQG